MVFGNLKGVGDVGTNAHLENCAVRIKEVCIFFKIQSGQTHKSREESQGRWNPWKYKLTGFTNVPNKFPS